MARAILRDAYPKWMRERLTLDALRDLWQATRREAGRRLVASAFRD